MIDPPVRTSGRSERGREQKVRKKGGSTDQIEAGEQVGTRPGAVPVKSARPFF